MKRQIRYGVFETNSSSVHSLTMCSEEEYEKWKNDSLLFWKDENKFGTREDIIEELQDCDYYSNVDWEDEETVSEIFSEEGIQTYEEFFDDEWFETYHESYTTPNGETVVAFGYYGRD